MKYYITFIALMLFTGCSNAQNPINTQNTEPCLQGINLIPLYGDGSIQKCPQQKESDENFLKYCDSIFPSRKDAAIAYVEMAWKYAEQNNRDNATKRFNQAWLLDKTNADVYWGLGIIQGSKQLYDEAEVLFKKSIELNPNNEKVLFCLAINIKEQHAKDDTSELKQQRIELLQKAIELNPSFIQAIQLLRSENNNGESTIKSIERQGQKQTFEYNDGSSIVITSPPTN